MLPKVQRRIMVTSLWKIIKTSQHNFFKIWLQVFSTLLSAYKCCKEAAGCWLLLKIWPLFSCLTRSRILLKMWPQFWVLSSWKSHPLVSLHWNLNSDPTQNSYKDQRLYLAVWFRHLYSWIIKWQLESSRKQHAHLMFVRKFLPSSLKGTFHMGWIQTIYKPFCYIQASYLFMG